MIRRLARLSGACSTAMGRPSALPAESACFTRADVERMISDGTITETKSSPLSLAAVNYDRFTATISLLLFNGAFCKACPEEENPF